MGGLLLCTSALPAQELPAPRVSQYGRYSVGFTVIDARDSSRRLASGEPRPVQLSIWYPATPATGAKHLSYRDYLSLVTTELALPVPGDPVNEFLAPFKAHALSDSLLDRWLDLPMRAVRDARRLAVRSPLILIAQGNGQSAHDQAALAEIVASYGYVVATSPSPMRITGALTSEDSVGMRAEEQADDLAFAWDQVIARPDVERLRVGVIGHSFGARAALLLAMRRPTTMALVSLDGGIGTATAVNTMRCSPSFRTPTFHTPLLHFYETLDPFMRPEFGLLLELKASERWLVSTSSMHHHHFTSLGAIRVPALQAATGGTTETLTSWQRMAQATVQFLEANVRRSPEVAIAIVSDTAWAGGAKVQQVRRGIGANAVGCVQR